jgi:hypothetical protein
VGDKGDDKGVAALGLVSRPAGHATGGHRVSEVTDVILTVEPADDGHVADSSFSSEQRARSGERETASTGPLMPLTGPVAERL